MSFYQVHKNLDDGLYFLNGKRTTISDSDSDGTFDVYEPGVGKVVAKCPKASPKFVDRVCDDAKKAQPKWGRQVPLERAVVLHRVAEIIKANVEELAIWETRTNGKNVKEAREDYLSSAETFIYYAGIAPAILKGDHIELPNDRFAYTRTEPFGVVGCIGAWNYPMATCVWKVAPALAAGNSVVYKPSPFAPGSPVVLGEILKAAGLPDGVYNVVQGEKETGEAICHNEQVLRVSFTGSVETGKAIQRSCAERNIKPVTLELGGKSAYIVFDDADIEEAVSSAILANFVNQGEVCTNATRVFVQKKILNEFIEKLVKETEKIKVGNPLDQENNVGALINEGHLNKVLKFVDDAVKDGATLLRGGKRIHPAGVEEGFYFEPAIFTDLDDKMTIVRDEIFGPCLLILPFDTEEEVVHRANNTSFGLAAGLHTSCLKRAHRVAALLEAGTVFVNTYNDTHVHVPFGGYKNSGHGRENSEECLREYVQVKSVYVNIGEGLQHHLD